jgi:ABC-type glutathione transport system ATPase component
LDIIDIISVSKSFGQLKALDDVNFTVREGETFGLVGESGSGKTTLARIILKLINPSHGEVIYFNGFSRKDFQMVFQNPYSSLNPRMKIGEIIKEPLHIHGIKKDIASILGSVELNESFINKFPHELSGGERQRVGIARAISIEPKFLVMDEPVSSLDVTIQADILKLIRRIKKELGLTIMFISHDLSVIRYMCDRVAVMKNGLIAEVGTVNEVYSDPKHSYTKELLSAVPKLSEQVQSH